MALVTAAVHGDGGSLVALAAEMGPSETGATLGALVFLLLSTWRECEAYDAVEVHERIRRVALQVAQL